MHGMSKPLHILRGFTPSIAQRIRDVKKDVKASWSAYLTNELKERKNDESMDRSRT